LNNPQTVGLTTPNCELAHNVKATVSAIIRGNSTVCRLLTIWI
jgi:hypothetical protein